MDRLVLTWCDEDGSDLSEVGSEGRAGERVHGNYHCQF